MSLPPSFVTGQCATKNLLIAHSPILLGKARVRLLHHDTVSRSILDEAFKSSHGSSGVSSPLRYLGTVGSGERDSAKP